jgi:steroid 5-alpha reductase family enzyme
LSSIPRYTSLSKPASLLAIAAVYVAAVVIGIETAGLFAGLHPIAYVLLADLVATLVVFAFSAWYRNASTYDPYWSVIPILIVLHWAWSGQGEGVVVLRQAVVTLLVCLWGARLTWNWVLRWQGLGDEDWRFGMLRGKHGAGYWLVNLGGIHMLPTLLVFTGCLATWAAVADSSRNLNWLDGIAFIVTLGAIWIEATADRQLRAHLRSGTEESLASGLWARCRHPNYLGEIGFWWGLYLFALAANPGWWWTGAGALAINLLFVFISIPMMDERMLERRPDYEERMANVPALLPRWS